MYKMEDGAPRLVLGSVRFEDGKPVVMAERVFAVPLDEDEAKELFEAEVAGTLELLTNHVETPSGCPNAQWLIDETPAKRKCTHQLGGVVSLGNFAATMGALARRRWCSPSPPILRPMPCLWQRGKVCMFAARCGDYSPGA